MSDEDRDRLARVLYEAHAGGPDSVVSWDGLKSAYPALVRCWYRAADAAVRAIVVVKVLED